jgi:ACT domain-containing protein
VSERTRQKHVEIYLLFEVMKPIDIVRKFGYSQSTVYKYYKEWLEAKKRVKELLKV